MHHVLALYFFVMAVVLSGLLYISFSSGNAESHLQSRRYWSWALALDVMGLLFFSAYFLSADAMAEPRHIGTMANTALFAAFVYQAMSFRASRYAVTQRAAMGAWALVLVFVLGWHVGREYLSADRRAMVFAVISSLLLAWQAMETHQNQQQWARSNPLRLVMFSIVAEMLCALVRVASLVDLQQPMVSAETIPAVAIATTWLQLAFKVIGYAAVTGYWVEVVTDAKTRIDMENQQFRALSQQQEKLIADLGRLNKTATTGVLAASIAHELNQPLQSAVLNQDMLVREVAKLTHADAAQELLQEQSMSLQRMTDIIQTMRGVFSESGATPRNLDLSRLIQDLGPLIAPTAKKHGIALQFESKGECEIYAKASELQQVILNLVGNAIDALVSHQTPQPVVRICVSREGDQVVCSVEDNGPGIAPDMHEEVFKILKSTKHAGMGLGLWLARYITQRNQGQMQIERGASGGAKLTIRLPRNTADQTRRPASIAA